LSQKFWFRPGERIVPMQERVQEEKSFANE
jgi:hypothetical protein